MSEISKQALQVENNQSFPNNTTGYITPELLRNYNTDVIDSTVNQTIYTENSASWNVSIGALNTFTSSQQPAFTNLNAFTASQLAINTGVNAATQSLSASIASTNVNVSQLQTWSGSINEIIASNVSLGYAHRFNFSGFITASLTPNVNGVIADISVTSDSTKVNVATFNDYTASTAATQSLFSASVATSISSSAAKFNAYTQSTNTWTASAQTSITQLLNFSSSLDATYATDAQLASATGSLINSIATKLNTSSFNSYTSSINSQLSSINGKTGSYATTGSNIFTDSQTINGALILNGNTLTVNADYPGLTLQTNPQGSGSAYNITLGKVDNTTDPANVFSTFGLVDDKTGIGIGTSFNSYAVYPTSTPMLYGGVNNPLGNDTCIGFPDTGDADHWKHSNFKYGVSISGSAYGNVISASIVSSTASIDLSAANYFTLTIPTDTRINVIGVQPGVTATLVINTAGAASASFSSNVKQSSGSLYVPSVSGNIDILSFTAVTTSSVYVVPAYTFV